MFASVPEQKESFCLTNRLGMLKPELFGFEKRNIVLVFSKNIENYVNLPVQII